MFAQAIDGEKEGVEDKEIDAQSSKPIQHPFRVLQSHRPADAMKAFDHGTVGPQIGSILVDDPIQRAPSFFVSTIAAWYMAVKQCRHPHGGYFGGILQPALLTPVAHLLMIALSQQ